MVGVSCGFQIVPWLNNSFYIKFSLSLFLGKVNIILFYQKKEKNKKNTSETLL